MKIPKYFDNWFHDCVVKYMNTDIYMSSQDVRLSEQIAWRAYRKGAADTKAKQPSVEAGRANVCRYADECYFELGDEQCNVCKHRSPAT